MNRQLHNSMMAQYATKKATGNGLVSWDGGVKCVMPGVKMLGKATQGTLTGKNLFDLNSAELYNASLVDNGVQCIIDSSIGQSAIDILLPAGTYTISFKRNTECSVYLRNGKVFSGIIAEIGKAETSKTFTFTADVDGYLRISVFVAVTLSDIQIELGSAATAYEPYCGGIPAPNLGYPIMPVCNDGMFRSTSPGGAWDGGTAQAPELWAIPGTEYTDEWDTQTGWGVRRVKKLVLTPDLKWYIYDKTGVTENNFAYLTGFINTTSSKLGIFSHGTYSAVEITVSDISAYMYVSGIFRIRTGHESTLADFKAFLQEQIDAGTPVTVLYVTKEPEPFYSPPARLTQPNGPGQIIQVSGSVPECPIEVNYLTHS